MRKLLLFFGFILISLMSYSQANLTYVRSYDSSFAIVNQAYPDDTLWKFTKSGYLIKYVGNSPTDTALISNHGAIKLDTIVGRRDTIWFKAGSSSLYYTDDKFYVGILGINANSIDMNVSGYINFEANGTNWILDGTNWRSPTDSLSTNAYARSLITNDSLYHKDSQTWLSNNDTIPLADSSRLTYTADTFFIDTIKFYLGSTNPTESGRVNMNGTFVPSNILVTQDNSYLGNAVIQGTYSGSTTTEGGIRGVATNGGIGVIAETQTNNGLPLKVKSITGDNYISLFIYDTDTILKIDSTMLIAKLLNIENATIDTITINDKLNIIETGSGNGIHFGDGDTRIYENSDGDLRFNADGSDIYRITTSGITLFNNINSNTSGALNIGETNRLEGIYSNKFFGDSIINSTDTLLFDGDTLRGNVITAKFKTLIALDSIRLGTGSNEVWLTGGEQVDLLDSIEAKQDTLTALEWADTNTYIATQYDLTQVTGSPDSLLISFSDTLKIEGDSLLGSNLNADLKSLSTEKAISDSFNIITDNATMSISTYNDDFNIYRDGSLDAFDIQNFNGSIFLGGTTSATVRGTSTATLQATNSYLDLISGSNTYRILDDTLDMKQEHLSVKSLSVLDSAYIGDGWFVASDAVGLSWSDTVSTLATQNDTLDYLATQYDISGFGDVSFSDTNTYIATQYDLTQVTGSPDSLLISYSDTITMQGDTLWMDEENLRSKTIYIHDSLYLGNGWIDSTTSVFSMNGENITSTGTIQPDVSSSNIFHYTGSSTATIDDLTNPVVGAIYYIINQSANNLTINDSGNFNLSGNWTGALDDLIVIYVVADNDYIEINRQDN